MTENFTYLMHLLACGACGTRADSKDGFNEWEDVLRLAKEQSVYYIILYALKRMTDCNLDQQKQTALNSELENAAIATFSRRLRILKLLENFDDCGIKVILLKGYAVASLYHSPDTRLSGDTDLYVDKKDEQKAQKFLTQQGFEVLPRDIRSHHAICRHSELGYLELHSSLFDEIVENVWFRKMGKQEYMEELCEKTITEDGTFYTLGKTDNLIFLALHMVKHFIESGMSLRLIMDFALFYLTNTVGIDFTRFWHIMEKLDYLYFMKIIICISKEYLNLPLQYSPDCADVKQLDILAVLNDMEKGGWLGYNDKLSCDEGWYEYNRIKLVNDSGVSGYHKYMIHWNSRGFLRALFPSRKVLKYRFPYVQRSILLVPVAWIHRFFSRGITYAIHGKITTNIIKNENQLSEAAKQRVALFKQIKIV